MSGESGNPHAGIEIGRSLRLAREKRDLSLQQVEEATKIRARYLRDLENENFDVLPAVYVLGSLKTYAKHLGLDGAAMTGELKRRRASLQTEQDQIQEDHPSGEPRGLLASLGRLVGLGGTVEDEAGTMAPDRRPGLYVSLVVVLVFVLATYLASSIKGEVRPSVSVVRAPTISQAPTGIALAGNAESDERDLNKENQPEKLAESPSTDTGNAERTATKRSGQEEYAPQRVQDSSSSATAFASASASASPASTGSAFPPATAAPPPTTVRPQPAAREQPEDAGREVVTVPPDGPSARTPGGQDPRPGFQRNQAESIDSTLPDNSSSTKVKISTKVKKTEYSSR
jgi:transcriptional regulator with XRE-family HTH domain